jgi:hypothetical protein
VLVVALAFAAGAAVVVGGCSRDAASGSSEADGMLVADAGSGGSARAASPGPATLSPLAPPARDVRADEEKAALADAGRFCGEKDLPPCPLQQWMTRNATPTIQFGETSALGELFDRIAALGPRGAAQAAYPNWASISRDGADAARMGDIPAAQAACRGCHVQYASRYHTELRALALPPSPPPSQGTRP